MKKISVILLSLILFLVGCSDDTPGDDVNSSLNELLDEISQFEQGVEGDENEGENESEDAAFSYENALIEAVGERYLEGRAFMRAQDEEVFGELCAVFQIGTDTEDKFTTEEWLAVSQSGAVYSYDVALDEWEVFGVAPEVESTGVSVMDCIYALNEVYTDSFSAEYYDAEDEVKRGVYEREEDANGYNPPALLLGMNEATPDGYVEDPATVSYMPVYNFNSKADIYEHFSLYFTDRFLESIQHNVDMNFLEFDGALYLTRGGMGYGMSSLNFDNIDVSAMQDNTLIVDELLFGEPNGKIELTFIEEDGGLKIDDRNYILMFDLYNVNNDWMLIEVPDFSAYTTGNEMPTASNQFEEVETLGGYSVTFDGEYFEYLPGYIDLLKRCGFVITMDGHEGFYSAEYYLGDQTITVNAYGHNEDNGVTVEVNVIGAVG